MWDILFPNFNKSKKPLSKTDELDLSLDLFVSTDDERQEINEKAKEIEGELCPKLHFG